ncbi:MAG: FIG00793915: hypothetical protein, partial [uncultured Rubrobacteraceae bacterium]
CCSKAPATADRSVSASNPRRRTLIRPATAPSAARRPAAGGSRSTSGRTRTPWRSRVERTSPSTTRSSTTAATGARFPRARPSAISAASAGASSGSSPRAIRSSYTPSPPPWILRSPNRPSTSASCWTTRHPGARSPRGPARSTTSTTPRNHWKPGTAGTASSATRAR